MLCSELHVYASFSFQVGACITKSKNKNSYVLASFLVIWKEGLVFNYLLAHTCIQFEAGIYKEWQIQIVFRIMLFRIYLCLAIQSWFITNQAWYNVCIIYK